MTCKPDLSFLSGEDEFATEESTPKHYRGFQQASFTGVGGPQGGFRAFKPMPFKAEVKTEYPPLLLVGTSKAVQTEVKPEPAVKDKVLKRKTLHC